MHRISGGAGGGKGEGTERVGRVPLSSPALKVGMLFRLTVGYFGWSEICRVLTKMPCTSQEKESNSKISS